MGQQEKQIKAYLLVTMVCLSSVLPALTAPPPQSSSSHHGQGRKFAVKHNNPKKVYHNKSVSPSAEPQSEKAAKLAEPTPSQPSSIDMDAHFGRPGGPQGLGDEMNVVWAVAQPMVRILRMMLAGGPGEHNEISGNELSAAEKKDGPPSTNYFTWGQLIGYGLKLVLAALSGGNGGPDGIDREDADPNPMKGVLRTLISVVTGTEDPNSGDSTNQTKELVNFVLTLMKALQSSVNQRSMRARSMGQKDRITDVTLAAIDMGKAYVRTFNTSEDTCRQQMMCEAARECVKDVGLPNAHGICHFTAMATANLMYYTQTSKGGDKTKLYLEAARRGRSQENCKSLYVCNETH
ncbi:hypothetical protein Ocin01_00040 [Orchesella cincta]|uniref:Secreted protein n=1 Tax=Orchesella cincta TaxID=48709 RepID=A0A1D2NNH6_ORCCI|nr:hypothetical protein Ocin01_00040 [Orchesella cincta]